MPDKDILNIDPSSIGDFDLPPLPARPVKVAEKVESVDELPEKEIDSKLPPLPAKTIDNSLDSVSEKVSAESLPKAKESIIPDKVDSIATKGTDLPQVKAAPMTAKKNDIKVEEKEPVDDKTAERFDFDLDYVAEAIDPSSVKLDDLTANVAPIRSGAEQSARNMKEAIKMNDLALEIGSGPLLDDLSDEYRAPEAKANDLIDKSKLDDDEKRILRMRLAEDLGRRPENFNARASQNLYNKLMEEKKLKISKKGFAISILPVFMGLASAAIAFFKMNWGDYQWFQYVAPFMALAAVLLLIKSKHIKMLSVSIYAVCALIYVVPGLILFTLHNSMQGENIIHIVLTILAVGLNIASILILIKSEAVNTYYSSNISRRK